MLRKFLRLHPDKVGNEDLIDWQSVGQLFALHYLDPGFKTSNVSWIHKGLSPIYSL